jgi:hypothetical protein
MDPVNINETICVGCEAVDTPHFTYKHKDGTIVPFRKCKLCHNHGSYTKKGTGWSKVPKEQQERIRELLKDRRLSVKDIATSEGLAYANFRRWISKGEVV